MEFAALDFETTGLDPGSDAVVSFGVVPVRGARVILGESVYREVSPEAPLTRSSIVIHGLRPMDLEGASSIDSELDVLRRALDGRFILAWAARIEAAFLAKIFGGRPRSWERRIVDVVHLAAIVDRMNGPGQGSGPSSLTDVALRHGVPVERPHHALDDALTTAQLFLTLMPRLASRGIDTPRRLLRAGRRRPFRIGV